MVVPRSIYYMNARLRRTLTYGGKHGGRGVVVGVLVERDLGERLRLVLLVAVDVDAVTNQLRPADRVQKRRAEVAEEQVVVILSRNKSQQPSNII